MVLTANYLLDKEFLREIDLYPHKEKYAKIISLDNNENPIDIITGKFTQGSVNIDGSSAIRRTCSLTMVCDDLDTRDYNWGLKTKIKLEVGLTNAIDSTYPSTI